MSRRRRPDRAEASRRSSVDTLLPEASDIARGSRARETLDPLDPLCLCGESQAARMRPTPSVTTAPARNTAPTYARFTSPFGLVAVGATTDRKNAAGIRIAAIGAPVLASHFQNGESFVSSTYRSMTSDRMR